MSSISGQLGLVKPMMIVIDNIISGSRATTAGREARGGLSCDATCSERAVPAGAHRRLRASVLLVAQGSLRPTNPPA